MTLNVQAPYTDEGWVDESADAFGWAKGLFGTKASRQHEAGNSSKNSEKPQASTSKRTQAQGEAEPNSRKGGLRLPWQR
jgi:hypothetical protein